jgi:Skp family chaperone for outer membrane proteins
LKDNAADMEKEFKTMVTEFDKSKEDYQKLLSGANDQAVSGEERDKRKKSAEDKLKQLKETEDGITQYRRQATNTLEEKKKRMRDNILAEIRTVLNAKAKTANFTMVVDVAAESANATPVVLYTNNDSDITDEILKQLNAAAPAATTAPKSDDIKKDNRKK